LLARSALLERPLEKLGQGGGTEIPKRCILGITHAIQDGREKNNGFLTLVLLVVRKPVNDLKNKGLKELSCNQLNVARETKKHWNDPGIQDRENRFLRTVRA
jgi:hypothetical protein